MKDEEFKEFLRKTLIEKGEADISTNGLFDKNRFMKIDIFENYFKKEIEEYKKEGIYIRFNFDNIVFSLYKDQTYSCYRIIKDKETNKFKTEYHSI